jgi:hypothetical protein
MILIGQPQDFKYIIIKANGREKHQHLLQSGVLELLHCCLLDAYAVLHVA